MKLEDIVKEKAEFMHEAGEVLQYTVLNRRPTQIGYIDAVREAQVTHCKAVKDWYAAVSKTHGVMNDWLKYRKPVDLLD